jgi:hypothetical protein
MATIRVFIGYDGREAAAFNVLSHSIHARSSRPVSITPVMLSELEGVFKRERNPLQSTEFSFSRFLVPYLCDYQGWAIFMDCDMLARDDIARLWELRDERYAAQVVQHVHVPKEETKFLGAVQTKYEKKNWTSVMLLNCAKCAALTPEFVNRASGLELHQFKWLEGDHLIGALPSAWNHLVGYDAPRRDASLVHYTSGGPYFPEYANCEYAREWFDEQKAMLHVDERAKVAKAS